MSKQEILEISHDVWNYYTSEITLDLIISSIADKLAGYHISYSATILLEDLGVITKSGGINKKGKEILSLTLHYRYHSSYEYYTVQKEDISKRNVVSRFVEMKRKDLEIRQQDLANLCGICRTTVVKIEQGKSNCSMRVLTKVFKALGVTVTELERFEGNQTM